MLPCYQASLAQPPLQRTVSRKVSRHLEPDAGMLGSYDNVHGIKIPRVRRRFIGSHDTEAAFLQLSQLSGSRYEPQPTQWPDHRCFSLTALHMVTLRSDRYTPAIGRLTRFVHTMTRGFFHFSLGTGFDTQSRPVCQEGHCNLLGELGKTEPPHRFQVDLSEGAFAYKSCAYSKVYNAGSPRRTSLSSLQLPWGG
ncbi:hypothetical protein M011DRAFT_337668 [Sporormia fimetaria CBS 119925]|uniref:Uncharacterized protein n=1 Tax=Sporormia fimetaria CBS 119925 TaxID=1340428 RepID=A0A6A6VI40_9PLEO|nr:hypothetical protein M011DRAFT_337668 [Sporormia fimetaria CBS 119925]